ncbi:fibronectin type III domain-containing protein [Paenibacillus hamazuiensis]|uniref:fibronectin type III domain-containing protein n=1 Tax=Paenibacillus hamazuiensis TaxID=2936508 RepID=UPI00200D22D1|nr:PA14 domain-containing protein [Paenibacillus hamazuiensis]
MRKCLKTISGLLVFMLLVQYFMESGLGLFDAKASAQSQPVRVKIHFQPPASQVPAGDIADYGQVYGSRNGFTYGWNIDHTDVTVRSSTYQDAMLDSSVWPHRGGVWEIALENGSYDVTVSVGDAVYGSTNTVNVEGVGIWSGAVLGGGLHLQQTKTIQVSDGKLTVDHGSLDDGMTALNFIEIVGKNPADTNPPSIPQNITSENVSATGLTVKWDSSADDNAVAGYKVYRDGAEIATVTGSVSYTDTGLSPAASYKYEIAAFDAAGNFSAKSLPLTVTTSAMFSALAASGQGRGVRAEYFSGTGFTDLKLRRLDDTIDFQWDDELTAAGLDNGTFTVRWSGKLQPRYSELYTLYTESHGGVRLWVNGQLLIDRWDANGRVHESANISLKSNQTYDIKMEYVEEHGVSAATLLWSSSSQTKEIVPKSQLNPPFVPEIPGNFRIASASSTSVSLAWDAVTGAASYEVEADGSIVSSGSGTTFTQNNLAPGSRHTYRVRARVPEVAGDWSDPLQAETKVSVPANVRAVESDMTITVTWDPVAGATGYDVEADGFTIDNGTSTTYVHSGLMPNTQHTYRVRAKSATGASDWSAMITKVVLTEIPTNVQAVNTSRSITLSWDAVIGATGYDVEADGQILDGGSDTAYTHSGLMPNTRHAYRVRARKADGPKAWSPFVYKSTLPETGHGIGLKGQYFDNEDLTNLKTTRIDDTIDFNWNQASPAQGIQDGVFSVRWTGQVEPAFSETYTFYTEAHGGVRLWVADRLLVDDWQSHNSSTGQGSITLEAGKRYDIRMEYRETNGTSRVRLLWESASQAKDIIPKIELYPIGVPAGLTSSSTETTVSLQWNPVTFADGYDVEVDGTVVDAGSAPSFVHNDVMPGTLHTYRVRARSGIVIGEWSPSITEATKLGTTSIREMTATETAIRVDWEPVYGATGYDIEVDGVFINNDNNTSYLHEGLLSGTVHSYRVRAKTEAVTGDWTSPVSKWTLPGIPEDIVLSSTSDTITLKWSAVRGATGYDIEAYDTVMDNADSTEYTESGLTPNSQHTYRVRAKNSSGAGKWSAVAAETTLPGVPGGVTGTATDTSVAVTWDAIAGASGYDIEIDGDLVEAASAAYLHSGLQPYTVHTYRVRSKNSKGTSAWSGPVEIVTLPSVPGNLAAAVSGPNITVSWNAAPGAAGYDLEIDGKVTDIGTRTSYDHTGAGYNAEHTYRVRAKNGPVTGQWSEPVTKLTPPGVPTGLQAATASTFITVSWDTVVGAAGYELEADGAIVDTGLNTSYEHNGLEANSRHVYRVRARNAGGAGEWSAVVAQATGFGAPQNVHLQTATDSITVTWDAVPGASAYDVFVDGEVHDNGASTTFGHTGLQPYSWHVYRVRAKTAEMTGEWSEAATTATMLGVPANLRAIPSSSSITVTWDAVLGASGYEIEADGVLKDNGESTTFTHTGLTSNSRHTYRVRAKNDNVYSDWSDLSEWSVRVDQVTAPGVPANLTATATPDSITLKWDAVSGADSYNLEIDGQVVSSSGTTYTHSGLEPNTMHVYRVSAANRGVRGSWTDKLQKITTPQLTLNIAKDTIFNFVFVVPKKNGLTERKVTVVYDPGAIEVLDLSAVTPDIEKAPGAIVGTNLKVAEFVPGRIVYTIQNADKTIVNSIQLQSLTNEYSKVTYTVE